MSQREEAKAEQLGQNAQNGGERVVRDKHLWCKAHLRGNLALCKGDHSRQSLKLLVELSLKREAVGYEQLKEGTLDEEVLGLISQLRFTDKGRVITATLFAGPSLLKLRHVSMNLLDVALLHLAVKLRGLRGSLRCDHQGAYQVVYLLSLVILLLLAHVEGLVHEVGQVGDGRDRVAVEAIDDDFVDEASEGAADLGRGLSLVLPLR